MGHLFEKAQDSPVIVNLHGAEALRLRDRDRQGCNCAERTLGSVVLDHLADVHEVDVIRAKDRHHFGLRKFDQVDVLVNGVGGALIPLRTLAHLSGHRQDELTGEQVRKLPGVAHVLQQGLTLELGQDVDRVDSRVHEIAQHEVDNPILAPEWHGGLASLLGERK